MKKYLLVILLSLAVSACNFKSEGLGGSSFEGSYVTDDGKSAFEVGSNGKLTFKNLQSGKATVMAYTINKDKLEFQTVDGLPMYLKMNGDGTLTSTLGSKLKKN